MTPELGVRHWFDDDHEVSPAMFPRELGGLIKQGALLHALSTRIEGLQGRCRLQEDQEQQSLGRRVKRAASLLHSKADSQDAGLRDCSNKPARTRNTRQWNSRNSITCREGLARGKPLSASNVFGVTGCEALRRFAEAVPE